MVREELGEKAIGVCGLENGYWIAMDYGDVMVHVMLPEAREYYDLEHLWADAKLTEIADVDWPARVYWGGLFRFLSLGSVTVLTV